MPNFVNWVNWTISKSFSTSYQDCKIPLRNTNTYLPSTEVTEVMYLADEKTARCLKKLKLFSKNIAN